MSLLGSLVTGLLQAQEQPYVKPKRVARPQPNKGRKLAARARRAYAFQQQLEADQFFHRS